MKRAALINVFLRSFFIQTALNFRRMQNLGFAFSLIPLVRQRKLLPADAAAILTRHLQMFNTHPYLSAPVLGSIVRMEEENIGGTDGGASVITIKQSLMGPYAAIGDTFFWGALKPLAAIVASALAFSGYVIAPLAFLMIHSPAHIWVRLKGFVEGYRRGKQGIEFIRMIELPRVSTKIRWVSLIILGFCALWLSYTGLINSDAIPGIVFKAAAIVIILCCYFLIKNGISQVYILYGTALIFLLISWSGFLTWVK
jgi:PTS system mannose-specific IID component